MRNVGSNGEFNAYGVVVTQKDQNNIFTVYCPIFMLNSECSVSSNAYKGCELKTDSEGKYVIKGLNGYDPYEYYR